MKSAPPPPPDDGLTADERAYKEKLKAIKKFAKLEKKAKKEKKRQKQEKEKKRKLSPASGGVAKKPRGPAKPRAPPGPKVAKALDKTARFASAMKAFLWWDAPVLPPGQQWRTMEHGGVAFPDPYEPHGVKATYDGEEVQLTPEQEEAVTFMAGMDPNGMHLGNEKTRKIFVDNFFKDFKKLLPKGSKIKEFGKVRRTIHERSAEDASSDAANNSPPLSRNRRFARSFGRAGPLLRHSSTTPRSPSTSTPRRW